MQESQDTQDDLIELLRQERRKHTAEDFTPLILVDQMLDKLPQDSWNEDKTFLDPTGGDGNFIIRILQRKLQKGHDPLKALANLYTVELMEDNVRVIKSRIKEELNLPHLEKEIDLILDKNIICYNGLEWDYIKWRPLKPQGTELF